MLHCKQQIARAVAAAFDLAADEVAGYFKVPERPEWGEISLPCFPFAKALRKAPRQIAAEAAAAVAVLPEVAKAEAMGPYLNITLDHAVLATRILPSLIAGDTDIVGAAEGQGKCIAIDYSSPNIAKPIAFHHIRSTVLGQALGNIYAALGWRVERINYLGDWGTTQGKLIQAFINWGNDEALETEGIRHLLDIYVRFGREAKDHPELEEQARAWFVKLEDGDPQARTLWQRFRDISIGEFKRIYDILGVTFDHYDGESMYYDRSAEIFARAAEKAGACESEGAYVIPLDDLELPPILLRKKDGATLYATRDIAAAVDRKERFGFDRSLYVVGSQQALYFRQLTEALLRMGYDWAGAMHHVPFGMLSIKDPDTGEVSTGSTRAGNVIFLEDVLVRAMAKVRAAVQENARRHTLGLTEDEIETITHQVGAGAIIFADLSNRRINNIVFDWDQMLAMNGDTGVKVQYTHARCASMLRQAEDSDMGGFDVAHYTRPREHALLSALSRYPETVRRAAEDYEPSLIARYLLDMTEAFGGVYELFKTEGYRFLDDDPALRASRMALVRATARVIREGLGLLGIQAPEKM